MKQTNNALKFLLAQYRAIFKNAYVKGLAAVALTAGLAVGAAQPAAAAAANVDNTAWPNLSGAITVDGDSSSDGTNGKYQYIQLSGTLTNNNDFTITISSGGTTNNYIKTDSAATSITASNGNIILSGGTAANAALLISGSGASGAKLDISTFTVGQGQLTLQNNAASATAAAHLKANTITLTGGTDSKVIFSGSGASNAVLEGQLVSTNAENTTLLDFSTGNGTLKTWGTAEHLDITVGSGASSATITAVLDLTDNADTAADEGKLTIQNGTIKLVGHATGADSGADFVISGGTLELGENVILTANETTAASGTGTIKVANGTSADGATLMLRSATLKEFLTDTTANTDNKHDDGALSVTKGTLTFTDTGNVTLNDFTFQSGGTAVAGQIEVASSNAGDTVITGKELTINNTLANTSKVNVEASKLTLGSETFKSSANSFG